MTNVSVTVCATAGRYTTIALTIQRRSAKKACRLIMKVLAENGAERQPRFRSAARGAPRKLETQTYLNFHHSACESLGGSTEVTAISEIGVALAARLKRRQVEHIKDVEKIRPEV